MKTFTLGLLVLLWSAPAFAACPDGQSAMLTVRLYFGQSMNGKAISSSAWRDFLAHTVTVNFPDGFTVYDAHGQWRDPKTQAISREASKVIEIAAPDTAELRAKIEDVREIYSARFHQQSVGLLTLAGCGTF